MNDQILLQISGLIYLIAMVFYIAYLVFNSKKIGNIATTIATIGVIVGLVSFTIRTINFYSISGDILRSIPITNLYESLQVFALLLMVIYIIVELIFKLKVFGVFATALSGTTILFIDSIGIPATINPLIPALQSNWLLAHVSLSFVAYIFFTLSAISALVYLILNSRDMKKPSYIFWITIVSTFISILVALILYLFLNKSIFIILYLAVFVISMIILYFYGTKLSYALSKFNISNDLLDTLVYRFAVLGFIIFTIGGLIFGAVWADQAWGRYWSWDPKETWAFITWLTYGVYLHGRLYAKWSGIVVNSLAIIGFLMTIFTFLGVNLLLSGLHSYGSL